MKLRKRTLRFVADKDMNEMSPEGRKRRVSVLRRSAREVMNYRILRKFLLIGVAIAAVVLAISYSFIILYDRTGRFSVSIENPDTLYAITLCEHPDFRTRSSRLTNDQQVRITNISGSILPKNIDQIDGEHNGENYLAYTFYCKNIGSQETDMRYELTFNNVTNHVDECMRVRLYVDGVPTNFAKTRSDGTGTESYFCDKVFEGRYLVTRNTVEKVAPNAYVKFTVVIWVEGDDPDCNDSVVNGKIKFDMNIEGSPVE